MQQMAWREALDDAADADAVEALDDTEVAQERRAHAADADRGAGRAGDTVAAAQQVRALMFVRPLPRRHRPPAERTRPLSAPTPTPFPPTHKTNNMALLQISEPGQTPDPHQRRIAVGIDLGTTHSLVAAVRHGVAECLPDVQGRVLLPSAVRYLDGRPPPDRLRRPGPRPTTPRTPSSQRQALHGPRWPMSWGRPPAALPLRRPAGHGGIDTRAGIKTPVEVSAEILATCASAPRTASTTSSSAR
jgi:hypothetical protein